MELDDLLQCPFKWGGRWGDGGGLDCYGLVLEVRRRLGCAATPDHPEIYQQFDRETMPPRKVLDLVSQHGQRVDLPMPGDVAVLTGERGAALGCYIGEYAGEPHAVIMFGSGERPVIEPDHDLPNLLGYWRYTGG